MDDPGFKSQQWERDFTFSNMSRAAMGPIQPHIQWILGLFPRGKAAGVGIHHSPPSCTEVKL
jgi:hypothetical protein